MRKAEVKIGFRYWAKVSDRVVPVRILSTHNVKGWYAVNENTGRTVYIRSAARLRGAV